jgi:hypothetical protein
LLAFGDLLCYAKPFVCIILLTYAGDTTQKWVDIGQEWAQRVKKWSA